MNKINSFNFAALVFAMLVSGMIASAQPYYSANLVSTNFTIPSGTTTNLVPNNYTQGGPYVSTKGVTTLNPAATGYTFQFVTHQPAGTSGTLSTNITATFAPILDDESVVRRYPASTNHQFTVTFRSAPDTNLFTDIVSVNPTNTLGAKSFKLISFTSPATNGIPLDSARFGFWQ